jgi:hypothetical protein
MSLRFAAALSGECTVLSRALVRPRARDAVNDNAAGFTRDTLLRAALKHFAEHGLAAAERARENAERAFFAGDRDQYQHWLEICRALDRRMAAAISARKPRHRSR